MILIRDVFRLKFGKAKDVKALMKESQTFMDAEMLKNSRVLFDLVGPSYTMVLETTQKNLSSFEAELGKVFSAPQWQDWYKRLVPFIEQSYREIFTVME